MDSIKVSAIHDMYLTTRAGGGSAGVAPPTPAKGSLHLTRHFIIFRSTPDEQWIPIPLLHSVTRSLPNLEGTTHPLTLRTRDFKTYDLVFATAEDVEGVCDSLKAICAGVGSAGVEGGFAFFYDGVSGAEEVDRKGKGTDSKRGWGIYQPQKEFERMGVGRRSKAWRFSNVNQDYEFCPSYPSSIVVPSKISDSTLRYAVKYRSKGRIPGLVYLHWANLGSITRSSQPLVGIQQNRSIQDEKLIEAIFGSHSQHSHSTTPSSSTARRTSLTLPGMNSSPPPSPDQIIYGAKSINLIIDARPTTNAVANTAKGAGTENMDHYKNCKKSYLGIDNIHVMRSSLLGVFSALRESESYSTPLDRVALHRTGWLRHLTNILDGILAVTRTIHLSNSHVLIHCSDGWDRTSQLSSLAQLCLDPYYRTAEGFAVLIEKDWLSYGHKFTDRTGFLCGDRVAFVAPTGDGSAQAAFLASVRTQFAGSSSAYKEISPVFQQFLETVYQILRQFPTRFQFGESLLRKLVRELYAGKTGTFLFNSERERESFRAKMRTRSVWEEIFDLEGEEGELVLKEEYRNDSYDPTLDDPHSRTLEADQGVLLVSPTNVKWWFEFYGRTDEEMNGPPLSSTPDSLDLVVDGDLPSNLNSSIDTLPPPFNAESRPPASPSPAPSLSANQVQLAEAVESMKNLGWGAWSGIKKAYVEARDGTLASSPSSPAHPPDSQNSSSATLPSKVTTTTLKVVHSRAPDGEGSNSGWKALGRDESGEVAELSSRIVRSPVERGGQQQQWGETTGEDDEVEKSLGRARAPAVFPQSDSIDGKGKAPESTPTQSPPSQLPTNPWDRRPHRSPSHSPIPPTSTESPIPTPPPHRRPIVSGLPGQITEDVIKVVEPGGVGGDPLGVGLL